MIKKIIFTLLSLYSFSCIQAKEIVKDFTAATITLEFPAGGSGSTKDKIIEYVSQDPVPPATENETTIQKATIHVLVPHHSQRIYDDPNDLKYEYTINYVLKDGWELEKVPVKADSPYEVNKMESADKIADATKETIYTLNLRKKIVEESNQSEDNSAEAKYQKAEYKIILYTPSIHLTLHAPSTHGSNGEIMKRPLTKAADTVKDFDTGYLGVMLRNEDNDDGDPIPEDPAAPLPRDNDDKKPGAKDDDLVAVLLELKHDYQMPDELKAMINLNLAFKKSTEENIRVFDEDKATIPHAEFTNPKQMSDPGNDKHLSKLINDGSATIYLEGLGNSFDEAAGGWGDQVDQITYCLTPGGEYKEASSHGLLLPIEITPKGSADTANHKNPEDCWDHDKDWFDFQGVTSKSPGDTDRNRIFIEAKVPNVLPVGMKLKWILGAAAGTLENADTAKPKHIPPAEPGEGVLNLEIVNGGQSLGIVAERKLVIYKDHLERGRKNFDVNTICGVEGWLFTRFGVEVKMKEAWNCHGSMIHCHDGTGARFVSAIDGLPTEIASWAKIGNITITENEKYGFDDQGNPGTDVNPGHFRKKFSDANITFKNGDVIIYKRPVNDTIDHSQMVIRSATTYGANNLDPRSADNNSWVWAEMEAGLYHRFSRSVDNDGDPYAPEDMVFPVMIEVRRPPRPE